MNQSTTITEYTKSTQNVCMCLAISTFLITLFMMTPLNSLILSSIIGKIIILFLLGYAVFYNLKVTQRFSNELNIKLTSGNWNTIKTNIICSYIFTIFLLILAVAVTISGF
jgi:hypothetical protein